MQLGKLCLWKNSFTINNSCLYQFAALMKSIKEPHIILSSTWRVGYTSTGAIQSPIYVIVCGDLGLCWAKDKTFDYNCKNFKQKSYTTLWVQGNHENFDMIAEFPIEEWHGGKVRHIVRDKVILLERGQVFDINGKTFLHLGELHHMMCKVVY